MLCEASDIKTHPISPKCDNRVKLFINLHITFIINVSSRAEFGNLGLDPSHFNLVPSSDGKGRKFNVDITLLEFVEFEICRKILRGTEN